MQQHFFSDRDIEEYLDGIFEGDIAAMRQYVEQTPEGRARLASVQALYAALDDEPQPALSFSIGQTVMDTLAARETKKGFKWNSILWIAGAIAAMVLLFYCFRFIGEFQLQDNAKQVSNLFPFAIFIALIIIAFQWTDVQRMKKRYDTRNAIG